MRQLKIKIHLKIKMYFRILVKQISINVLPFFSPSETVALCCSNLYLVGTPKKSLESKLEKGKKDG